LQVDGTKCKKEKENLRPTGTVLVPAHDASHLVYQREKVRILIRGKGESYTHASELQCLVR
jgi:hypothetical protein